MRQFYDLKGRMFTEPPEGKWYNLRTGRTIARKPEGYRNYILNTDPRVAGDSEMLHVFFSLNRITIKDNEYMLPVIYKPTTTDVELLPEDQIKSLRTFSINHPNIKVRVCGITDANTIEICFFFNFAYIAAQGFCFTNQLEKDEGFFLKMHGRLEGVEFVNEESEAGKDCIKHLRETLQKNRNIVFCGMKGFNKDGKLNIHLYSDSDHKESINRIIIDYRYSKYAHSMY